MFHQLFFFFSSVPTLRCQKRRKLAFFFMCFLACHLHMCLYFRSFDLVLFPWFLSHPYICIYITPKKKKGQLFFFFCQALLDYSARKQSPRRKETGWRDSSYQRTTTKEQVFFFFGAVVVDVTHGAVALKRSSSGFLVVVVVVFTTMLIRTSPPIFLYMCHLSYPRDEVRCIFSCVFFFFPLQSERCHGKEYQENRVVVAAAAPTGMRNCTQTTRHHS